MSNQAQNPNTSKKYDLAERPAKFGESSILFAQSLPDNSVNRPLVNQFVRSATSTGANYMEADGAESKKDFRHKIGICKKESKESMHWTHMLAVANPSRKEECRVSWKEAHELALIFSAIINKS
ncbi:MAG: four helix bundle protein [Candidatus Magasanikbacteria bacterium]|nr:four helix bundle protein [Candidatus Magasanikbacteria bacterium]